MDWRRLSPVSTDGGRAAQRALGRAGMMNGRNVSPQPAGETPYVPQGWLLHFVRRHFVKRLDIPEQEGYAHTMQLIRDALKKAIRDSGLSDRSLGIQAEVNRQSIARFVSGQTSLTLDQVERLAEFFGLELRPIESAKPKKGRK